MKTAILLSGGMDSISLAYWKRPDIAFTIDYGQLCAVAELRTARHVASILGLQHEVLRSDCRALGSGDLAGSPASDLATASEWWPFRNQLLITLAAMRAVALEVKRLLVGSVASDSIYCDGTAMFYDKIDSLLAFQEGTVHVEAPALDLTTVELVRLSGVPREVLLWSHSCHVAEYACGMCRGCNKHMQVLSELGYIK